MYATNLATQDSALSFAAPSSTTPVIEFSTDSDNHGYFVQIANQSTGGAATFSMLVPVSGKPVLTCVASAPVCRNGKFKLPASAFAVAARAQQTLYAQIIAIIVAERRYAAAQGGTHIITNGGLAIANDRVLSFAVSNGSPITQLGADVKGFGYYVQVSGVSATGFAQFTAVMPHDGVPRFTCVGAVPLCKNGAFSVPLSDYRDVP